MTRPLHPGAWWLWAGALATAAMRTRNPVLLSLIGAVAAYVVAARRPDAPWARSFGAFLRIGLVVLVVRVLIQVLVGQRLPGNELFTLPEVELPELLAGVTLGGPVTVEAVVDALYDGLRLAVILGCFGAANSLASPYRLLRCLPGALYEAGVAVTVALSFAPQAVTAVGRVREARRLRGRPTRGVAGVRGVAVPVLEGALQRSVDLAASMDSRGYGRRSGTTPAAARNAAAATLAGLVAVLLGTYGVLDAGSPSTLGLPTLALGGILLALGIVLGGRGAVRTRYRPDRWTGREWLTAGTGVLALAGVVAAGRLDPGVLAPGVHPLESPAVPLAAVLGIVAALAPLAVTRQ